ncbi:MAG: hypothetical protein ACLFQG_06570 [Desulfovermiculus sp.]
MYAHKVLESYLTMLGKSGYDLDAIINHPVYRLKNSAKYHFEDIESIRDMTAREDTLSWGKSDDGDADEPKEYYDEMIQESKNINACLHAAFVLQEHQDRKRAPD